MIGRKLKLYRQQSELTQNEFIIELAKHGVVASRQSISKYELGTTRPSTETLIVIAKVLNKQVSDFLEDSNEMYVNKVLNDMVKEKKITDANNIPKNLLNILVNALIEDVKNRIEKEGL